MAFISLSVKVAIAILMVDSIIELSFVSSMVAWLHRRAGRDFEIDYDGGTFPLHGKPLNLIVDQGHTSNGAAGTAFVLIGLGGILALWLQSRAERANAGLRKFGSIWYHTWLVLTVLSTTLTLAALIYTFVVTNNHKNQTINISLAASLDNHPYPNYVAYPENSWTPENWFTAMLHLPLESTSDRSDIKSHLRVMRGWRWNLVPMFIIGLVLSTLALVDYFQRRHTLTEGKILEVKNKPEDDASHA